MKVLEQLIKHNYLASTISVSFNTSIRFKITMTINNNSTSSPPNKVRHCCTATVFFFIHIFENPIRRPHNICRTVRDSLAAKRRVSLKTIEFTANYCYTIIQFDPIVYKRLVYIYKAVQQIWARLSKLIINFSRLHVFKQMEINRQKCQCDNKSNLMLTKSGPDVYYYSNLKFNFMNSLRQMYTITVIYEYCVMIIKYYSLSRQFCNFFEI